MSYAYVIIHIKHWITSKADLERLYFAVVLMMECMTRDQNFAINVDTTYKSRQSECSSLGEKERILKNRTTSNKSLWDNK